MTNSLYARRRARGASAPLPGPPAAPLARSAGRRALTARPGTAARAHVRTTHTAVERSRGRAGDAPRRAARAQSSAGTRQTRREGERAARATLLREKHANATPGGRKRAVRTPPPRPWPGRRRAAPRGAFSACCGPGPYTPRAPAPSLGLPARLQGRLSACACRLRTRKALLARACERLCAPARARRLGAAPWPCGGPRAR